MRLLDRDIFLLVICYRSPNRTLCNYNKLFDLLLDLAQRNYNNIFIVVDFNYCTIDRNLRVIRSHSESITHLLLQLQGVYLRFKANSPVGLPDPLAHRIVRYLS